MFLDIAYTVSLRKPQVPFEKIARELLPRDYSLSLVLCGDSLSRRLNRENRKKDYSANVLSFPLSKTEGEIFINVRKAAKEAGTNTINARIAHLFVHAILHLKGLKHSDKMDGTEQRILRRFGFWQK